jgi:hypothetical protein
MKPQVAMRLPAMALAPFNRAGVSDASTHLSQCRQPHTLNCIPALHSTTFATHRVRLGIALSYTSIQRPNRIQKPTSQGCGQPLLFEARLLHLIRESYDSLELEHQSSSTKNLHTPARETNCAAAARLASCRRADY